MHLSAYYNTTTITIDDNRNIKTSSMVFIKIIDILECYLIPIFIIPGFIGNLSSSLCIFNNKGLRKSTTFFILAIIGIVDNIFLLTQMQRWMALCFRPDIILIDVLCKVYFFLIQFSIQTSSALLLILVITRFIKLYHGNYKLSLNSSIGQMCSKLSVVYIITLTISTNWHRVWTSGSFSSKKSSVNMEDSNSSLLPKHYNFLSHCIENVEIEILAQIINILNNLVLVTIYLLLFVFSITLLAKVYKRLKYHEENNRISEQAVGGALILDDKKLTNKRFNKKNKPSMPFTKFLILVSLLNSIIGTIYLSVDLFYFKYVNVNRLTVYLENCLSFINCDVFNLIRKSFLRLSIVFINFNYSARFYLLFFFYKKFRVKMYNLLRLRLQVNLRRLNNRVSRKNYKKFSQVSVPEQQLYQQNLDKSSAKFYNLKAKFEFGNNISLLFSENVCKEKNLIKKTSSPTSSKFINYKNFNEDLSEDEESIFITNQHAKIKAILY